MMCLRKYSDQNNRAGRKCSFITGLSFHCDWYFYEGNFYFAANSEERYEFLRSEHAKTVGFGSIENLARPLRLIGAAGKYFFLAAVIMGVAGLCWIAVLPAEILMLYKICIVIKRSFRFSLKAFSGGRILAMI